MDLEELRAFLMVAETGSFLAAEQRLGMPRATLQRRVEALEARAGVSLLHRMRQGVSLTVAGASLADRGRIMAQEAAALVASVRELGREPAGVAAGAAPAGDAAADPDAALRGGARELQQAVGARAAAR